jgi:tripartite-type tricarboxylate transporter receptor subunit TctC
MTLAIRILFLGMAIALHSASSSAQQSYPSKPIRYLVPYSNGGFADVLARSLGQNLQEKMGQPVIIDNRPAAGQAVALEMAARAAPDGYTMVYGTQSGLVLLTATRKSLPYDPVKDFAPIGTMFSAFFYLVVNSSLPVKTVQELIAYAKAHPGKLSFASNGVGSGQHLAMELFRKRTGIDIVHVPYKGSAFSMTGLIAGEVQLMMEGAGTVPHMKSGKIRGLGAFTTQRSPSVPDLPTLIESGVPGDTMQTWLGLAMPAGTPRPIIDRLNREAGEWLRLPATREQLVVRSLSTIHSTPEEMAERVRTEIPMWTKIIREAGIEPE